jgi:hypothetical protein
MALPASGTLSVSQINVEIGNAANATLNLGDAKVRALSGSASGTNALSGCRGKFYVPAANAVWNGGLYLGNMTFGGHTYALILAPWPTSASYVQMVANNYMTYRQQDLTYGYASPFCSSMPANSLASFGSSMDDGLANTNNLVAAPSAQGYRYEAALWADAMTIAGYTDWYVASMGDLTKWKDFMAANRNSLPAEYAGYRTLYNNVAIGQGKIMSSTQMSSQYVHGFGNANGLLAPATIQNANAAIFIPVRRVLLS